MSEPCRTCGATAAPFGKAVLLGKHSVQYFRCPSCGFVQTEKPYWLAEAYEEAISGMDVGAVSRNLRLAPMVGALIRKFFAADGRFLDYGGGTGLFVRLMRDAGFDFRWSDKFAKNIFAKGFAAGPGPFELLTAFEVFEHLEDPVAELQSMLAFSKSVLLTTVLLPNEAPPPGSWWYYGLEHGQHIALHTESSLRALANRFGLNVCSAGELHLLTDRPVTPAQFKSATRPRRVRWINRWSPRPSLTEADYKLMSGARTPARQMVPPADL